MFKAPANRSPSLGQIFTSHDVDKYVHKEEEKLQSSHEKKGKAFEFACLYFYAQDYVQAKRQLENYLSIQDQDFRVHNLMGEINEAMHNYPDALSSYERSLELCRTQKDILIKVISLCSKYPIDPSRAKVWADKGSQLCPGHPAVFKLKWHLQNDVPSEEEKFKQMKLLIADESSVGIAEMLNRLKLEDSKYSSSDLLEELKHAEVKSLQYLYNQAQIYIRLASECDTETIEGQKDHLYYIKKAEKKLLTCISNSDHSPEFKQAFLDQLHKLHINNDSNVIVPAIIDNSQKPNKSVRQIETNAHQASPSKLNEEEPEIHVEAIVQASKLDSITTGEEVEEIMFTHRAKLFRYDSSVKQWKERGLGDVKLAHNKYTNICRIIMRREQIHKLCANHAIMPSMELSPLNNSNKAWTWFTQADISDGETKAEQFALKFKTAEIANDFKENFEKCKNLISNDLPKEVKKPEGSQSKPSFLSKFAPKEGSWSCPTCLVQNEGDASHCPACQTAKPGNTPNQVKPFSFKSANDTSSKFKFRTTDKNSLFTFGEKLNTLYFESSTSPFVFGQKQSSTVDQINIQFGNKESSKETFKPRAFEANPNTLECPFCLARNAGQREFCRFCSKPKEKTPMVKLNPKEFSTPIMYNVDPLQQGKSEAPPFVQLDQSGFFLAKKDPSTSGFLFEKALHNELLPSPAILTSEKSTSDSVFTWKPEGLNIDNLFSFGSAPSPSLSAASSVDDVRINTEIPSAFDGTSFNFQIPVKNQNAPKTPESKTKEGVLSALSPQTPTEEYDDEADTSGFVPLVTLSQVSHSTGEEGEEVLFEERSKMFLFNQQWKGRGVGDLKILRDNTNNHHRLVMRRDQTHKICANHLLVAELTIKPMSGSTKAFVWKTAADISDGEPSEAMFAAKFKDEEKANRFAKVFTTACQGE